MTTQIVIEFRPAEIGVKRSTATTNAKPIDGELVDLSASGAKITVSESLRFAEAISPSIGLPMLPFEIEVNGQVCWIRPTAAEAWLIGCSFDPPISGDVFKRTADKGYIERRQERRNQTCVQMQAHWQGHDELVDLKDLSAGGFSLQSNMAAAVGEKIFLKVPGEQQPYIAEGTVQWQVKDGDLYFIGCLLSDCGDVRLVHELANAQVTSQT